MIQRKWEPKDPKSAFFPVEMRPIYMPTQIGQDFFQKLKRHFAVVDVEQQQPFAVVTDGYRLVTNKQAYDMAAQVMKKVFHTTQFSDMECLNITMSHTRSFCHIDLIHKTANFSPWEEDKWTAFLRITNSYNKTRRLRFELGFCRWICLNGMIFGNKSVEVSYAHTKHSMARVDNFIENIGDIRKLENTLIEKLHQLKRYHVPEKEMLPILCRAFDIKLAEKKIEELSKKENKKGKRIQKLIALREQTKALRNSYFTAMGQHGYAALNVLTDYASYPEGGINQGTSMHGLQQKAGNWMEGFVSAIKSSDFSYDKYLVDYRQTAKFIESL